MNTDRRNRSIYSVVEKINSSNADNHLENSDVFRQDFTSYSVSDKRFESVITTVWDKDNVGGIPVDYSISNDKLYVDSSDSHTLILGATGSKKTRLAVMPMVRNLADAGESMIICDPKAEIYNRTSGYLHKKGYKIHALNFRDPSVGDGWNMFSVPYKNYLDGNIDKAAEQINDIAVTLMPVFFKDPYWDYSARDVFVGLTLMSFYIGKKNRMATEMINMGFVLEIRMNMFKTSDKYSIMNSQFWKVAERDNLIKSKLIGTVSCPEKTMSCILSSFDSHVSCFLMKPALINMLSKTTIGFEAIGEKSTAIYIILPDEKTTLHKICSVFVKQIYELLIDYCFFAYKDGRYKKRINFILDEFSSLPVIEDFPQMISASRSRNIRFTLVSQSKGQIVQRYQEEADTIQSNCTNWLFFFTREVDLLKEISSLAGYINNNELIPIHRLQHLNKEKGECLVFSGRHYPYFAHLADISQFDNDDYSEYPFLHRKDNNKAVNLDELLKKCLNDSLSKSNSIDGKFNEKGRIDTDSFDDIQKELERKFDELFGNNTEDN